MLPFTALGSFSGGDTAVLRILELPTALSVCLPKVWGGYAETPAMLRAYLREIVKLTRMPLAFERG